MEKSASELLTIWEQRIDGYMMRDPGISLEVAQKAAMEREKFYRGRFCDGKISGGLSELAENFRRRQLNELGIDPETVEVKNKI
jgi:hypothetical protein